jgi:capsular exopolysaccharide synthesis family protein
VRRHLDLPCLAGLPRLRQSPFAINTLAGDPRYEVFQAAATVLRGYLADREGKTVVVAGAAPREGRTAVAVHLAASMARKGLRVVLVDGDLRRPFLHAVFNLDNQKGLTGYLGGAVPEGTDPESLLGPTEVSSLRVFSAGGAVQNPVELLDSARMADLVRLLRERNDVVVIDSPALETGGDALALARLSDTTVLVAARGTDRDRAARARDQLVHARADIAGAILTFSA